MVILNRTVFEIPLTWDRMRFEATRNKTRIARKLIETSINGKIFKTKSQEYHFALKFSTI